MQVETTVGPEGQETGRTDNRTTNRIAESNDKVIMGDTNTGQVSLEQVLQQLATVMTLQRQQHGPSNQLGPLPEYSGEREELEQWIHQARAKLRLDYVESSEETKFFALHNKLRGEAASQLQPWVKAISGTTNATAENLFVQLEISFGDPHKQEKAQRKLHQLRQTNKSFMEYFVEYRRLLLEAGGTDWPDAVKKSYLRAGLSQELQEQMIGREDISQSLEAYCDELKKVSDQMEAFRMRNRGQQPHQRQGERSRRPPPAAITPAVTPLPGTQNLSDKMDWQPSGPATMVNVRRAKWVSQEELDKRKREGRCFRCGTSTHMRKGLSIQTSPST